MKSIIIIQLCVLLLTIVSNGVGAKSVAHIMNDVDRLAKDELINGVFKLADDGFLGIHKFSATYKGTLYPMGIPVAMKFTGTEKYGINDHDMYDYLNAFNSPNLDAFGIPSIYYYGQWNECIIMAMTVFDSRFQDSFSEDNYTELDFLILFREFVRISKFTHSRGVFLQDASLLGMMFHKHQGFIYDFSTAVYISNYDDEAESKKQSHAQFDWNRFFRSVHIIMEKSDWGWLGFSRENANDVERMQSARTLAKSLKGDDSDSDEWYSFTGLRRVFAEFARHAYSNASTPEPKFYDRTYKLIVKEIKRYAQQNQVPAIPSWILEEDKENAILAIDTIPPISSIPDPFAPDQASSSGSGSGSGSGSRA